MGSWNGRDEVFAKIRENPQHQFLFLTKRPDLLDLDTDLENAWFGVTVTRKAELWRIDAFGKTSKQITSSLPQAAIRRSRYGRPFRNQLDRCRYHDRGAEQEGSYGTGVGMVFDGPGARAWHSNVYEGRPRLCHRGRKHDSGIAGRIRKSAGGAENMAEVIDGILINEVEARTS